MKYGSLNLLEPSGPHRACHGSPLPSTLLHMGSRDSSVVTATCYGLDGPGIECRWGRDFPHPSRPAHPASYTMGTGSFPGVKRPGRGVDHPSSSSAEGKERVQLQVYSPSGLSWPVLGRTLPVPYSVLYNTCISKCKKPKSKFSLNTI